MYSEDVGRRCLMIKEYARELVESSSTNSHWKNSRTQLKRLSPQKPPIQFCIKNNLSKEFWQLIGLYDPLQRKLEPNIAICERKRKCSTHTSAEIVPSAICGCECSHVDYLIFIHPDRATDDSTIL